MPRKGTSLAYRIWFLPFYPPSIFARPEECPTIKSFAKKKGVDFTMMDKVDVNGVDAHPVYHYLKKVAGPVSINIYRVSHFNNGVDFSLIAPLVFTQPKITWNFATYVSQFQSGVSILFMFQVLPILFQFALLHFYAILQYIVSPSGSVQSFSGVEPLDLVPYISKAISGGDEL
jgi:hypothetical protein